MPRRLLVVMLAAALLGGCAARPGVISQTAPVVEVNAEKGVALKGYDPVAYFTGGAAVKGKEELSYRWSGTIWRFSSEDNRTLFTLKPEAYAPQYGGYCAYAMSRGLIADISPTAWAVVGGKLYLNNNGFAHQLWNTDRTENIVAANQNWPLMPRIDAPIPRDGR